MNTATDITERYRIRSRLRCEGAGRLECAEDKESGMRTAIRWLPLEANGESAARALGELPLHPALPKIRSTGTQGDAAWVAMDFPEGKLLSSLPSTALTPDLLASIGADVADALVPLHAQGVVHGELATDSVLLIDGRTAVLWDLPLVLLDRLTDRRGGERNLSVLKRKASLLAPEVALGNVPEPAADVYGIGVILCVAFGSPLPTGATTLSVLHQVATGEWRPKVPTVFPESIQAALERMIDRDPAKRPHVAQVPALLGRLAPRPLDAAADATVPPTLAETQAHHDTVSEAKAPDVTDPRATLANADAMSTLPPMLASRSRAAQQAPTSETKAFDRRVSSPAPRTPVAMAVSAQRPAPLADAPVQLPGGSRAKLAIAGIIAAPVAAIIAIIIYIALPSAPQQYDTAAEKLKLPDADRALSRREPKPADDAVAELPKPAPVEAHPAAPTPEPVKAPAPATTVAPAVAKAAEAPKPAPAPVAKAEPKAEAADEAPAAAKGSDVEIWPPEPEKSQPVKAEKKDDKPARRHRARASKREEEPDVFPDSDIPTPAPKAAAKEKDASDEKPAELKRPAFDP